MEKVVIVDAVRTAVGKFGGTLKDMTPAVIGGKVISDVLRRTNVEGSEVNEVIMGNVLSSGHGQNIARQASVSAGIPKEVPAFGVNKVCGSGLKAVVIGAQSIMLGDADVAVCGGVENMSMAPYALKGMRWGAKMGNSEATDLMVHDGLWDVFNDYHMGITAENVAEQNGISREDQDGFAAKSQQKAEKAIRSGAFKDEIVPIEIKQRKGDSVIFEDDEFPRFGTTIEALNALKPAFKKEGTVTAGNASGINDGAAAVLLMSAREAERKGLRPIAEIVSYGSWGLEPELMGMGPVGASKNALEKAGIGLDEVELIELNEAFAAQSLAVIRKLGLDEEKINVNGGAIALGHPIGASGARILVTLVHEIKRRKAGYGLASLCIGGGQGIAMIVKGWKG